MNFKILTLAIVGGECCILSLRKITILNCDKIENEMTKFSTSVFYFYLVPNSNLLITFIILTTNESRLLKNRTPLLTEITEYLLFML